MTLIEELNKLVENGVKIRDIEAVVNFPKNQLSAILKKHKKLPKKWEGILGAYVSLQDFNKRHTIELPKDFIGVEKIGIIRANGTIEELKNPDQLPPEWATYFQVVKTVAEETKKDDRDNPFTNAARGRDASGVNEDEAKNSLGDLAGLAVGTPKPPTTLDELKALCPKELTGFDRSAWIATNRVKYDL